MHLQVLKGDKEMKVEIEDEHDQQKTLKGTDIVLFKRIKGSDVFNSKGKKEIELLVNAYLADIIKKWNRFHFEKKPISCVKINKS